MTNHVHLLMTSSTGVGISHLMQHMVMQHMGRHYVQPFNFKYARSGTLFGFGLALAPAPLALPLVLQVWLHVTCIAEGRRRLPQMRVGLVIVNNFLNRIQRVFFDSHA